MNKRLLTKTLLISATLILMLCCLSVFSLAIDEQTAENTGICTVSGDGRTVIVLKNDGTVWTWGNNDCGELGDGTTGERYSPAMVENIPKVKMIADYGGSVSVLTQNGEVWSWGNNDCGQLGDGTTENKLSPVKIDNLPKIKSIVRAFDSMFAVAENGDLWTWGNNAYGQLGDGSTETKLNPAKVSGLSNVKMIICDAYSVFALTQSGEIWSWGNNKSGQLGDGSKDDRYYPEKVDISKSIKNLVCQKYSVGSGQECSVFALTDDGEMWTWGFNEYGKLGYGYVAYQYYYLNSEIPKKVENLPKIKSFTVSKNSVYAITDSGDLWSWGENNYGQLGDGTRTTRSDPLKVNTISNVKSVTGGSDCAFAVTETGDVWSWGYNTKGQLGNGTTIHSSCPEKVEGVSNIRSVVCRYDCVHAITEAGDVWAWGSNQYGQLGIGLNYNWEDYSTLYKCRPSKLEYLSNVQSIGYVLFSSYFAFTEDGDVWSWGYNERGDLGLDSSASCISTGRKLALSCFDVFYDANGGTGAPTKQTKVIDKPLKISSTVPVKNYDKFLGWAISPDGKVSYKAGDQYTENKSTTLYAIWQKAYMVEYDANGGTSNLTAQIKYYGDTMKISSVTPTRLGYDFLGWSTSADGEAEYYPNGSFKENKDVTLYAVWAKSYIVKYTGIGQNFPEAQTKHNRESLVLSGKCPTRKGYKFIGWSTDRFGIEQYFPGDTYDSNNNLTLYAIWGNICQSCNGTCVIKNKCSTCNGTGKITVKDSCYTCNGTGQRSKTVGTKTCDYCDGVGLYYSSLYGKYKTCGICNGTGKMPIIQTYTCDICSGRGYKNKSVECNNCSDGYISHACTYCLERGFICREYDYDKRTEYPATCTTYGYILYSCSRCHMTRTKKTEEAKGHVAVTDPAVSATCKNSGLTEGSHCSVCNAVITAQKEVPATGKHTYTTATTKATTAKDGQIVKTCKVCEKTVKTPIYKASSIKLSKTSFTYNGKTQKPTITVKNSKGTTLKNGTDYTVSYSSGCKNTGKYAVKITFKGNYSGTKTLYFNILPSKTSKLTVSQSTTSIKATWNKVTGASGYKVTLYNSSGKAIKTVDTTKTTYTFSKLSKGTTYKVRVTAYKTIDSKKVSSSVYTQLTTATKIGTPTLKVTAGTKKASLSWNKQTGATGYVVYMSTSKNGKFSKIATVKGKVSYTKTGLTKGKTYYFKVAAYTTVGGSTIYGGFSSVKSVKIK